MFHKNKRRIDRCATQLATLSVNHSNRLYSHPMFLIGIYAREAVGWVSGWEIAIGVPLCGLSIPGAHAVNLHPTATTAASVSAAWALLPSPFTVCRVRYSLLLCCCCTMLMLRRTAPILPSFIRSFPLEPAPPYYPVLLPFLLFLPFLPYRSVKLQTVSTLLQFGLFFTKNMRFHQYHGVLPRGRGLKLAALPRPVSPAPPPSPVPYPGYCTQLTFPLHSR